MRVTAKMMMTKMNWVLGMMNAIQLRRLGFAFNWASRAHLSPKKINTISKAFYELRKRGNRLKVH
jgi:hypothetical protein